LGRLVAAWPELPDHIRTAILVIERIGQAPAWEKHFPATIADRLIELYTATDKPDEVAKWQAERAKHEPPMPGTKK
jgi:hypothetical protein